MSLDNNVDQFKLLEDKIDNLIQILAALKKENESFSDKFELQETKIADLNKQVNAMNGDKDKTRQKIVSILDKIDKVDL